MANTNYTPNTLALHAGYEYDSQRTLSVPIYQSSAYNFESSDQAGARFALAELGNIYSRLTNPTTDVLANRLAAVEGGAFGTVTSSGSSALFYAFVNLAESGDNIVYANKIYGGTQTLLVHTLKRFGIEARVFDVDNIASLEKVIDSKTKAIFFESLSNPQISIPEVDEIVAIAKKHKIVTICDNTVATAFLFRPFEFGIDVSVHSCTKYINGHGSGLGGAIIEREGLNDLLKGNPRYPAFNTPDPSYHGLVYASLPYPIFSIRIITEWLRNIGASLSPQNAWIHLQGLETLELRIHKHSENALQVAHFLESHPAVKKVEYPALESSPYYARFKKYFKKPFSSGLLSFEVGSYDEAKSICDRLKLYSITANIGDSKSLVIHPASTTHSQLSEQELLSAGISPASIRLSIGLESIEDLIADLARALSGE